MSARLAKQEEMQHQQLTSIVETLVNELKGL
jgi:hypothetical protein